MNEGKGKRLTNAEQYQLVVDWVKEGNFAEVARQHNMQRMTVSKSVRKFQEKHPEEFQKIMDAFLLKNKQEMIFQNTHTTKKALEKVDELLDDTTSLKEAAMAYGILYDKGALMKGESTQNSAIIVKMAGNIEELSK